MSASVKLRLKPLMVPNYAIIEMKPRPREEGMQEAPKLPIAELDDDALEELAFGFLTDLYKKAGKRCPFYIPARAEPAK